VLIRKAETRARTLCLMVWGTECAAYAGSRGAGALDRQGAVLWMLYSLRLP